MFCACCWPAAFCCFAVVLVLITDSWLEGVHHQFPAPRNLGHGNSILSWAVAVASVSLQLLLVQFIDRFCIYLRPGSEPFGALRKKKTGCSRMPMNEQRLDKEIFKTKPDWSGIETAPLTSRQEIHRKEGEVQRQFMDLVAGEKHPHPYGM